MDEDEYTSLNMGKTSNVVIYCLKSIPFYAREGGSTKA